MPQTILDLSTIIDITVESAPTGLGPININTAMLVSKETPLTYGSDAYRVYTNPNDVATDWGSSSNAFKIATGFFSQQPNVLTTQGYLAIAPRLISPSLESTQDAVIRLSPQIFFFGILTDEEMDESTFGTLTAYIQSVDKMFFYASSNSNDFQPAGMLYALVAAGKKHTRGLYYTDGTAIDTQIFAASYCSRGLSTDFSGSKTTQTMNLKTITGLDPDLTVTETVYTAAQVAGVDVYGNVAGVACILTSGANGWFDDVYNPFWLKFALQMAGFNYLKTVSTKIPQTEAGMDGLKGAYQQVLEQGVSNGYIAPGKWNSPILFGNTADLITAVAGIGYYIYSTPISQQSESDRTARIAPLVQIAAKAAGAIHKSNVIVNVED